MKKLIYLAFFVLALSATSFADGKNMIEKKDSEASYFALNQFSSRFQNATNVNWVVTDRFQKASFMLNGKKMSAFFDINGDYIATTQYLSVDKLPAVSKNRIAKLYKDYAVEDVIKYDIDVQDDNHLYALTGRRNYNMIYFASLKNEKERIVVKITPDGEISYLKSL